MFLKAQKLAIKKKYWCSLPPIFFMLLIFLFVLLDCLRVACNSFNINQDTFKTELKELLSITTTNIKIRVMIYMMHHHHLHHAFMFLQLPYNSALELCDFEVLFPLMCFKNFYISECAHVDPSSSFVSC